MEIKELLKIAFRAGQQVEISGIILDDDAEFDEWIEENQHLVKSVDSDGVGGSYRMLKEGERIQVGDEFIDNNGKWRMSGRFDEIYTRNDYYPHRRLE